VRLIFALLEGDLEAFELHKEFFMMQFKRNPIFGLCAAFAVAITLNACGNTQPVITDEAFVAEIKGEISIPTTSFVGKVNGTNAFIAIVERAGVVKVYVCDGTPTGVSVAEWFDGSLNNNALNAESAEGSKIIGTRNGSSLSGTVTLNGVPRTFSTSETNGTEAGLWVAYMDIPENVTRKSILGTTLSGWVVLPDGSQHGAAISNKTGDVLITQPAPDFDEPITNGIGPFNPEIDTRNEGDCHNLQRNFKTAMKYFNGGFGPLTTQESRDIRDAARFILKDWLANCEGTFGPIIGPEVPLDR
jgi:hypothetical protein